MRFRQALFWDTDPKKIDPQKHAKYIIERILDFGNDSEVKWLYQKYPKSLLRQTIFKSRCLRHETKNLWKLLLQNR
ncbi:MAG: hypothetical protein HY980_00365 [Candidatus Magasanikbacteria bacterium]|nr:hypothetical protein [Candidatus Magasanikbacteria bacterium]